MIIISKPLRIQFFLENMVFMAPTPKRVSTVATTETTRASVQVKAQKANGNIVTRAARPKDTPHSTPALTGLPSSSGASPNSSSVSACVRRSS